MRLIANILQVYTRPKCPSTGSSDCQKNKRNKETEAFRNLRKFRIFVRRVLLLDGAMAFYLCVQLAGRSLWLRTRECAREIESQSN